MELLSAIRSRQSVRSFKRDKVPRSTVYKLLDAARWAPSAGNLQSWEFVIVEDEAKRKKLAVAALGQEFVAEAPVVIVACADTERSFVKYGARGKYFYSIVDVSAAIQNLLLAATSLGLGTCWVGSFNNEMVREAVGLPEGVAPVAIIPIGKPAAFEKRASRTSLGNVVHFEEFGNLHSGKTGDSERAKIANAESEKGGLPPQAGKPRERGILDIFK